eukprot:11194096-Lingulodinium_polyedra.AAC.1
MRANVRFASRRGNGASTRSHHCATFVKRGATVRSNRPSVATTARESHAHALHARASFLACAWSARAWDSRAAAAAD